MGTRIPLARWALAASLLVAVVGCSDTSQPADPFSSDAVSPEPAQSYTGNPQVLTVYTQNVYLGGDTGPVFSIDFSDIPALIAATSQFWAEVQASDVPERVSAVVDELDARGRRLRGVRAAGGEED